MNDFENLKKQININIKNDALLRQAFIHRSYLNECEKKEKESNEKLEFLGDSVVSLVTTIYLFKNYPDLAEGDYTDIKSSIVRMESLHEASKELSLGDYILLSSGEEKNNGRNNQNILADTFEALVACIFIDQGFETAYEFIKKFLFKKKLDYIVKNKLYLSPKSRFQEIIQSEYKTLPNYKLDYVSGPEHEKEFFISVFLHDIRLGKGSGRSKKQAEESAAKNALENLKIR